MADKVMIGATGLLIQKRNRKKEEEREEKKIGKKYKNKPLALLLKIK